MNRTEASRLARSCLPGILNHEESARRRRGTIVDVAVGGDLTSPPPISSSSTTSAFASDTTMISECDVNYKSVCRLWAGMGHIYEVSFSTSGGGGSGGVGHGTKREHRFIVKCVAPPPKRERCTGDERKANSYAIESNFYRHLAPTLLRPSFRGEDGLRMPVPYHVERNDINDRVIMCMSVLDGSPSRYGLDDVDVRSVLRWLASFHSRTWHTRMNHDELIRDRIIQSIGSYWHLPTRPDEHSNMSSKGWEGRLKLAAWAIHERLRRDDMQCVIHGDVKDANMLFAIDDDGTGDKGRRAVGMYDFQYCGRAPPSVGFMRHSTCIFFSLPFMCDASHSCSHVLYLRSSPV